MIEELLSNVLLIVITLIGLGYIVVGKPKKNTKRVIGKNKPIYIRKDNFTKRLIKTLIAILVIIVLIKAI